MNHVFAGIDFFPYGKPTEANINEYVSFTNSLLEEQQVYWSTYMLDHTSKDSTLIKDVLSKIPAFRKTVKYIKNGDYPSSVKKVSVKFDYNWSNQSGKLLRTPFYYDVVINVNDSIDSVNQLCYQIMLHEKHRLTNLAHMRSIAEVNVRDNVTLSVDIVKHIIEHGENVGYYTYDGIFVELSTRQAIIDNYLNEEI